MINSGKKSNLKGMMREIGEGKLSIETLEDSAINKLTKQQEETTELEELDDEHEDSFDKIYKGEISKSGTAILPSKRTRRIPEKANLDKFSSLKNDEKEDEIKETSEPSSDEKKSAE